MQDGEALVQLCVLPAQAHIHNKQKIGCFSSTAHIPRNTNNMTYHLEAVEEKIQLSRHPINLCTHLDCTSIWQIYFIFIVVSKKSGSSWSMKSLKNLDFSWSAAPGNLSAQDFHPDTAARIQQSFYSGQQPNLFSCFAPCWSLKLAFTATTSTSTEAKKNSATAVKPWKTKGNLNCKQKRGKWRKDRFPISLLVWKTLWE